MSMKLLTILCCLYLLAEGHIWFKEDFNNDSWKDRWIISDFGDSNIQMGAINHTAGSYYGNIRDKGLKTSENNKHYALSAEFKEPFTNRDSDLIIQMSTKNEHDMLCGGMYIKLYGREGFDPKHFNGQTPYQIMFGPDICGEGNSQTHAIFYYQKRISYMPHREPLMVKFDKLTHLYTLWIKADNTYEYFVDMNMKSSGTLDKAWGFHTPREIPDPYETKPKDWVDEEMIVDPNDVKPEGWDDTPAEIPDPKATKPDSWDESRKGLWEPPSIPNPEYFGKWVPRMIKNPNYKGEWIQPMIPNPKFISEDLEAYLRCIECNHVGIEVWQNTAGTIFDDIMISDSFDDVLASWKVWTKKRRLEHIMYEKKLDRAKQRHEELLKELNSENGEGKKEEPTTDSTPEGMTSSSAAAAAIDDDVRTMPHSVDTSNDAHISLDSTIDTSTHHEKKPMSTDNDNDNDHDDASDMNNDVDESNMVTSFPPSTSAAENKNEDIVEAYNPDTVNDFTASAMRRGKNEKEL